MRTHPPSEPTATMAGVMAIGDNRRMPPFSFIADASDIADGRDLAERALRAESMGVTTFAIPDHLVAGSSPRPRRWRRSPRRHDAAVSAFVLNNDLRHPAVLAQDLATLDVLSGGRLDVALGAGWNKPEYDAIGLPFDPVGTRVGPADQGGRGDQGLLRRGPVLVPRRALHITDYDALPEAGPAPHPPFFIGGGGRRTLTLAAREADIVGLAPRILGEQRADPHEHHLGRDRGEDRLGPGGGRRAVRRPRVQRLPVGLADHRHRRPSRRGPQGDRPPQEPDRASS